MPNRFDVTINGTQARLMRGAEKPGYVKRWVNQKIRRQDTDHIGLFVSNPERLPAYQTSWAKGSAWWKPTLTQEADSYFLAHGLDTFSRPGSVVPLNELVNPDDIRTSVVQRAPMALGEDGTPYVVANTTTVDGSKDLWYWNPATDAWVLAGFATGITFSAVNSHFYARELEAVIWFETADSTAELGYYSSSANGVINSTFAAREGSCAFMHNGMLVAYNGNVLTQVADPLGTPALTTLSDDGMGFDYLSGMKSTSSWIYPSQINLAISTAEGIYYVKNVSAGGPPTPWIFRVERDAAGNWTGVPIATLPVGNVALSIGYHLGSVVIAATNRYDAVIENNAGTIEEYPVTFYHVTGGNLGTIGVPLMHDEVDEIVWKVIGSDGPYLYLGGTKRIWVYDGVRGGLHPMFEHGASRAPTSMGQTRNSSDQSSTLFWTDGYGLFLPDTEYLAVEEGAGPAMGDYPLTYWLESNYFDFNLPMEEKSIVGVHVLSEVITDEAAWTVQVSVDDGAWTTVATHTDESTGYSYTVVDPQQSGMRFRYRVGYETVAAAAAGERAPLRALMFEASSGKKVAQWHLRVDGTEFMNIEGIKVDPEDVFDAFETLGGVDTPVVFVDTYRSERREDAVTYDVTVESVEVSKGDPHESYVDIVLQQVSA